MKKKMSVKHRSSETLAPTFAGMGKRKPLAGGWKEAAGSCCWEEEQVSKCCYLLSLTSSLRSVSLVDGSEPAIGEGGSDREN
jgi:hypothetical protein